MGYRGFLVNAILRVLQERETKLETDLLKRVSDELIVAPATLYLCMQEAVATHAWLLPDDVIGASMEGDWEIFDRLTDDILHARGVMEDCLGMIGRISRKDMFTDAIHAFMDKNMIGLMVSAVHHLSHRPRFYNVLFEWHLCVSLVFSQDTVYRFEHLLLESAETIARNMARRIRSIDDTSRAYAELVDMIRLPYISTVALWSVLRMEVARHVVAADVRRFIEACPFILREGQRFISFVSGIVREKRLFVRMIIKLMRALHSENDLDRLVCVYSQCYADLAGSERARGFRFVETPEFLCRVLTETRDESAVGAVGALAERLPSPARTKLERLIRAQTVKRVLSSCDLHRTSGCVDQVSRVLTPRSTSVLRRFVGSVSGGCVIRGGRLRCLLVCPYTLPEYLPQGTVELEEGLAPELDAELREMRANNPDLRFSLSPHFGYAEFDVTARDGSGVCRVTGHTAHAIAMLLAARAGAEGVQRSAVVEALGNKHVAEAAIERLVTHGLLEARDTTLIVSDDLQESVDLTNQK
ncbi:hypothetical pox protein [Squirrelpox virus]|uniref:A12L n=1 Tax=Squirrelpox virus TaxID=240426 RepID=Q1HTT2_9POXV|nr:hypothetical pox protein [Squirrelpox virus]ABD51454.1 A12L [Squirrelpox virus]CCD83203.1 hypothetical pox protein [Squirrelpox virus]